MYAYIGNYKVVSLKSLQSTTRFQCMALVVLRPIPKNKTLD